MFFPMYLRISLVAPLQNLSFGPLQVKVEVANQPQLWDHDLNIGEYQLILGVMKL